MERPKEMVLVLINKNKLGKGWILILYKFIWCALLCFETWVPIFAVAKTNPYFLKSSPLNRPVFSHLDSLFIIAATGEPRFKGLRDSCEKLLLSDPRVLDYLLTERLISQTPRQRRYVERVFCLASDSGRRTEPVQKLTAALKTAPDSVKVLLLQIGSEIKDSAFLSVSRQYLLADSELVRIAAVRSLGMYVNAVDVEFLFTRIEKTSGPERQENLWALEQHSPIREWKRLSPNLQDGNYHSRQFIKRILASSDPNYKGSN